MKKTNIVNDKVDEIHTQVKEWDHWMGTLENKVDLNHALVMKRIDNMEDQINAFKTDQHLSPLNSNWECYISLVKTMLLLWVSSRRLLIKIVMKLLSSAKWLN